jgi:hypothetical protein
MGIWDMLPPCVEYMNNAWISFPGSGGWIPMEPDIFMPPSIGWSNMGMGWVLLPCEWIEIMFDVHVIGPYCLENINWAYAEGYYEYYPYDYFFYEDYAIIHPVPEGECGLELVKEVYCDPQGEWVDYTEVAQGATAHFRIGVHNSGVNVLAEDIWVYDFMEPSLEYADNALVIDPTGVAWAWEPDDLFVMPSGTYMTWKLGYDLAPCEWLWIYFDAIPVGDVCSIDTNFAIADYFCPITQEYLYSNEDSASVHIIDCLVCADAGGPYQTDDTMGFTVQFDGSGSFPAFGCAAILYDWDFGDGNSGTGVSPLHTYTDPCPDKLFDTYTVTLTVTCVGNPTCTDTDTTTVKVFGPCAGDPPIISIIYPMGGETLSGVETIQWFALDSHDPALDIYIYLGSGGSWNLLFGPIANDGAEDWNTATVSDGTYQLKVEAINNLARLNFDTSADFTVSNGIEGARVSSVAITDTTTNSNLWVKNGDTVEITAGITSGETLDRMDIVADLSGFSMSNVYADSFDGFTARWMLTGVTCNPSDGPITVTVTADNVHSNSATITADNTDPEVSIVKPETGLYLFNRKFLPLPRTVIFGPITIEINAADNAGISKAEYYIDGDLKTTTIEEPFDWYMNLKLRRDHTLKIIVYDHAGNAVSEEMTATIYNLFGN